jgi:hypothetical protein
VVIPSERSESRDRHCSSVSEEAPPRTRPDRSHVPQPDLVAPQAPSVVLGHLAYLGAGGS